MKRNHRHTLAKVCRRPSGCTTIVLANITNICQSVYRSFDVGDLFVRLPIVCMYLYHLSLCSFSIVYIVI